MVQQKPNSAITESNQYIAILEAENRLLKSSLQRLQEPHKNDSHFQELSDFLEHTSYILNMGNWRYDFLNRKIDLSLLSLQILELPSTIKLNIEDLATFFSAEAQQRIRKTITKAVQLGEPFVEELPLNLSTGELKWLSVKGMVLFELGNPVKLFGTIQDITAEKQISAAHELLKHRYFSAFNDSFFGMAIINHLGEIEDVNTAFCSLTGFTANEIAGKHLFGIIDASEMMDEKDDLIQLMNGKLSRCQTEKRCIKKDGTEIWLLIALNAIANVQHEPRQFVCQIKDISNRVALQKKLEENGQMYESLFYRNPAGVFSLDMNGCITSINDVMTKDTGFDRNLIIGAHITTLVKSSSLEKAKVRLAKSLMGEPQEMQIEGIAMSGKTYSIIVFLLPIVVNNRQTGVFGIVNDITISVKNQRALQKSEDNLRCIFSNALVGYILCNEKMQVASFNMPAASFIQKEFNAILEVGLQCGHYLPPDSAHPFVTLLQEALGGKTATTEYAVPMAGTNIWEWYFVRFSPVTTQDEQTNGMLIEIENITQQKNTEEQLLRERNQLQTLINNIPDAIYVKDSAGRKLVTNKLDMELMNVNSEAEVLGKTDLEIFDDELGKPGYEDDMRIIETGTPIVNKTQDIVMKDGKVVWLLTTKIPLKDEHDNVTGLMGIGRDISSYINALEEIRKSNERFEFVTQATFDAIWDWDVETGTVYRGEGYETIFGYKKGMLKSTSENWEMLIHEEDRKEVIGRFEQALNSNETRWQDEYRFLKPGGEYAYVVDKGVIVRNEAGKCIRMIGAMQDITSKKAEEEQLRIYEMVVKNINDAVLITNADTSKYGGYKIQYVNDTFLKHTGYTREEIIGQSPKILQGPKSCEETLQKMKESFAKWEPIKVELLNYKKNGEEFWAQLSIAPVADETGRFTHWVAIQSDITRTKERQMESLVYYQLNSAVNGAASIEMALQAAIEQLCNYHQFDAAEAWVVNFDKTKMLHRAAYIAGNEENERQFQLSTVAVVEGQGLVGTAFKLAETVCWENLQQSLFIRKDIATQFNWQCGLAVPVLYEGEVIAVFNFFAGQPFTQRQLNSKLLQKIQQELGTSLQKIRTETELNNFFELSPDLLTIISRDGHFRKVNAAVLYTLGYKEEELLQQKSYDLVHPLDKEAFKEELQRMLRGGSPRYMENRMVTSHKSIRWLGWSFTPVVEDGLIFAVAKDITYHKKLEAEKESILESITDYFYTLDNQFNYTYLNSAAQYLLAKEGESLKGKNIWQQFPVLMESNFFEQLQLAMQEKKPQTFEYYSAEFQTWFEQSVYPTDDGLSVFFRSINDRKETESKLNELNKSLAKKADELAASNSELERFAFVASHDLQEPLRMISGFMQLLQKKYEPQLDDNGKKYVNFAIDGAVRMKNLIQELLNYSKAGNLETALEPVDMSEVMADVKMILKTPIANTGAVINSSIMPVVNANITMVTQLMQNLIGNGIKYQLPGNVPIIEVSAEKREAHWEFSVKDNGIGIGKEYQDKVFELFHRLHTKQQYAGTGIGLSICKKIVEKLGGDIWVTSEEGKGSNFKFTIPFC